MTRTEDVKREYNKSDWGKLLIEMGFEPYDTEMAARNVARCAAPVIADLRRALRELLRAFDEERRVIDVEPEAWCQECTRGTTPSHEDKGPCPYHFALLLLKDGDAP